MVVYGGQIEGGITIDEMLSLNLEEQFWTRVLQIGSPEGGFAYASFAQAPRDKKILGKPYQVLKFFIIILS